MLHPGFEGRQGGGTFLKFAGLSASRASLDRTAGASVPHRQLFRRSKIPNSGNFEQKRGTQAPGFGFGWLWLTTRYFGCFCATFEFFAHPLFEGGHVLLASQKILDQVVG
jgi:hypothetical protein